MCYNYCTHPCTFEEMATGVKAQKHLRLILSYLGAQCLFKAMPSVQCTQDPNIFKAIDMFGRDTAIVDHIQSLDNISPTPLFWHHYWYGCLIIFIKTKISGLILGDVLEENGCEYLEHRNALI